MEVLKVQDQNISNNLEYGVHQSIAYIGFGKDKSKSMPVLSVQTLEELREILEKVKKETDLKGLVFYSKKPGCFLAGVDIEIINGLNSVSEARDGAASGQNLFNIVDDLKIPSVALVDGLCLGGGLELALSCDYIIGSTNPKTMFALPEVKLGVLPGFGGTYRLPRRLSLTNALDMMLTGKMIRGKKAKKIGLIDQYVPVERFSTLAEKFIKNRPKKVEKSFKETVMEFGPVKSFVLSQAKKNVMSKTHGHYPAPLKIIELLGNVLGDDRKTHLKQEAKGFGELSQSVESKSLQHIFFLTDEGKKKSFSPKTQPQVERGAVLGAGTMGGGIAWLFADNRQSPIMKDINLKGIELGYKQASKIFSSKLKRRRISKDEYQRKMRSIKGSLNYSGFESVDLVVEAVVENMKVKKSIFKELENEVKNDCVITSNTSSLSIEEMASVFKDPSRFAGLHFFNPVNKMPLVEIIRHSSVSEETIERLYRWCLKVKKTPIVVNDGPGFLVNRILMPFINESMFLLEEGVSVSELDKAVRDFGMPMGPCRLMDEIGIDVLEKVGNIMGEGLGERAKPAKLGKTITETGHLGKKSGKGFYVYDQKGKSQGLNPEVQEILDGMKKRRVLDTVTIQNRVVLPMINEAAAILDEKIADSAATIDIGLVFGIGFPPFKGGLLKYADQVGIKTIAENLSKFSLNVSEARYTPHAFLTNLAEKGHSFYRD